MNAPDSMIASDGARRALVHNDRRIGGILAAQGKLDSGDIGRVLEMQQVEGLRFGEASLRLKLITVEDLCHAIATQYELPHLEPDNERVSNELVVAYEPFHPCAEEIRALRTQLLIRWTRGEMRGRMLAIVSAGRGDGRSYLAANLAVAFAQLGQRTLLIDADLRRPRQHRIFDVSDRVGLSAVLGGRAGRAAVVALPELGPLYLLPAGACPPNPLELLSRDAFGALLRDLQPDFDFILFDTPPAESCADAHSVVFRSGNVLVVARRDRSCLAATDGLVAQMNDAGAHTVGTVFNAF
jgi:receptor protein-tyrosine kinase